MRKQGFQAPEILNKAINRGAQSLIDLLLWITLPFTS